MKERLLGKENLLSKEGLVKVEKAVDGGTFVVGAMMVASGIPALIAFGGAAAVYSGTQFVFIDRFAD